MILDKTVFFFDNASIHKSINLIKNKFKKEFGIIYNAAYSPELNPIEFAFCKIKNIFRGKPMTDTSETP